MNNRQVKILRSVFSNPVPQNLVFRDLEGMLKAAGCEMIEGKGSRVGFRLGGRRLDLHRPHPGKEAKPYQVRAVKEFLEALGVKP